MRKKYSESTTKPKGCVQLPILIQNKSDDYIKKQEFNSTESESCNESSEKMTKTEIFLEIIDDSQQKNSDENANGTDNQMNSSPCNYKNQKFKVKSIKKV